MGFHENQLFWPRTQIFAALPTDIRCGTKRTKAGLAPSLAHVQVRPVVGRFDPRQSGAPGPIDPCVPDCDHAWKSRPHRPGCDIVTRFTRPISLLFNAGLPPNLVLRMTILVASRNAATGHSLGRQPQKNTIPQQTRRNVATGYSRR